MRLLFVTPEVTPYSGFTPTGDACWALPKALKGRGHEVTIVSPFYGFIDPSARALARRLRKVETTLGDGSRIAFEVYDARTAAGVDVVFLGHEELFRPLRELPLGSAGPGDLVDGVRFGAFCKGVLELLKSGDRGSYDVVHCHDWHTALVPVLVSLHELEPATVMSVHDASRQGLFAPELLARLGLPERLFAIDGLEFYGQISLLKGGVLEADRVTTVAPAYAREIAAQGGASGLEGVFRERKDLVGIAGGVDVAVWNPATDPHLEARFDPMDLGGKQRSKAAMQRELRFPVRDDVALVTAIGPIDPASGLDVLGRIIGRVMRNDLQLAIVADEGAAQDRSLVHVLEEHAKRWPDRLAVRSEGTASLVHRALAASDCVLVPPYQAPGGSLQLRAHRYGALPIGRRAGSIADTVVDCDAKLTTGTGFLFEHASDEEVLSAVQRAIAGYAQRRAFERTRLRALRADHGWDRSAYLYERLYQSI